MAASEVVEAIVMEIIENAVEASVEDAVEEVAEEEVEQAVGDVINEDVEAEVEELAEDNVQAQIQEQVEEEVEHVVENEVENAVEEAGEGFWRNMMRDKVLPAVIAGITSGLVIEGIRRAIDASKSSKGEGSPSKDTEKGQTAASKVLEVVDRVSKRWKTKFEEYQTSGTELGTFSYKGADESVGKTVGVLVTSMKTELEAAKDIAVKSTADKTWNENIEEFKWRIANACEDVLAVFEIKNTAANLQKLDFPPDSDKTALNTILDEQMPHYKAIIKAEVTKHLQAAVSGLSQKEAATAVKAVIREPLTAKIKAGFNAGVRPDIIKEAKEAAKAEATVVINSKMADINNHVAIPVYGIATLKSWMEKNVEPVAIKEATKKAKEAANATLQLPPAQIKIMKISKTAREEVMKEYQTQIKEGVKKAVEEVIKQALKDGKKSKTSAAQGI